VTLNSKPTLFISRPIAGIEELRKNHPDFTIVMNEREENLTVQQLYHEAKKADALITMLCDKIDNAFLSENSHLRVVANYAVGLNNIDLRSAATLNIKVGHTPNVLTHSTAETAIMLLLNLSRQFNKASSAVVNGQWKTWEPTYFNGEDLRQKKIGIIGFGRIGQDFAAKAHALWKCPILVMKRESYEGLTLPIPFELVDEQTFFKEVDIISLHCPLNDETQNMINGDFIQKMHKPFFLINTARGAIHNEEDLIEGLKNKKLKGVGLDVTDPEPMSASHKLLESPLVIVLPHIGSATDKTRFEMTKMSLENIQAGLNGFKLPYDAFS